MSAVFEMMEENSSLYSFNEYMIDKYMIEI